MPDQPAGPRPRIPLAVQIANRFASTRDDSKLVNGFIEQGRDNTIYVYQRPGLSSYFNSGGAANGNGVFNWNGDIFSIFGPTLYKNGVSIGTVDNTNGVYTFSTCLGSTPKLFLQNGVKAYTYSVATGLVEETYTATITTTGDTHSNTTIDNIPSTAGMTANSGISGAGIPSGSYIVSVDSGTQVTINTNATATASGVAITVQTVGFPATFVKGSAYLDSTTYVMTPSAEIYGSGLNDPTTWNPLNKIIAQIEPDRGVFVSKQLVYVIAFKKGSVEVFYDAANAVGSPLGPVQGAKVNLGCWHAGSVQQLEGVLVWVSQTQPGGGVAVLMMEGLKAQQVSTPPIERLLEQADSAQPVYSWFCRLAGHRFYGVTIPSSNLTLVFDIETRLWYEWTDQDGNYWPYSASASLSDQEVLIQHISNGKMYKMSLEDATDDGVVIAFDLVTPNWDGESRIVKLFNRMDFVGDQIDGCVIQVRFNDWDFDPTRWSQWRTVDMNTLRPNLKNCGSARRRIVQIRKRTASRLRLEAIELDVMLGTN